MFCRNCGNEIPEQAAVCVKCGFQPWQGKRFCHYCGAQTEAHATVCYTCGVALGTVAPPDAKSKLAAGLLGIFLGGLGIHRFYLGYTNIGIIQIVVTVCTCGFGGLWGVIEGILILAGSTITMDAEGRPLKD